MIVCKFSFKKIIEAVLAFSWAHISACTGIIIKISQGHKIVHDDNDAYRLHAAINTFHINWHLMLEIYKSPSLSTHLLSHDFL